MVWTFPTPAILLDRALRGSSGSTRRLEYFFSFLELADKISVSSCKLKASEVELRSSFPHAKPEPLLTKEHFLCSRCRLLHVSKKLCSEAEVMQALTLGLWLVQAFM